MVQWSKSPIFDQKSEITSDLLVALKLLALKFSFFTGFQYTVRRNGGETSITERPESI